MFELPSWEATARDFHYFLTTTNRSERTATTYVYNVRGFWRWCMAHESDPRLADRPLVRHWINARIDEASRSRAHNDLAALKCFFAYCRDERWRDDDPTLDVNVKRPKVLPTKPLTPEQLDTLVSACTSERDRLILLMLAYTGMRISEFTALRAEDIDWRECSIKVSGKGSKERLIYPNPETVNRLHAFVSMFPAGPLWTSVSRHQALSAHQVRKIIYAVGKKTGIEVHPHMFRAFFGSEWMLQFHDLDALQGMMGHEDPNTTSRYTHWSKQERGREMMRRFGAGRTA